MMGSGGGRATDELLSALLLLVTDPSAVKKNIESIQAAIDQADNSSADAAARHVAADVRHASLDERETSIMEREAALEPERAKNEAENNRLAVFATQLARHQADLEERAQALDERERLLASNKAENINELNRQAKLLSAEKSHLDAIKVSLDDREQAIAASEDELQKKQAVLDAKLAAFKQIAGN